MEVMDLDEHIYISWWITWFLPVQSFNNSSEWDYLKDIPNVY